MKPKVVFVTVGTTCFDELVKTVLQSDVLEVLERQGYTDLKLQIGRGVEPVIPRSPNLHVSWFRLKDSIHENMAEAAMVISHAGAGSCTEVLRIKKPLIVCVNESLMGNHQSELAEQLHRDGHSLMCYPRTLLETLESAEMSRLKPFPPPQTQKFSIFLESLMGFA
nr:EOG090X0KOU [Sida crystallina]